MIKYTLKRLLQLIPVIILVSFTVFALMDLAPGDLVDAMDTSGLTVEEIAELRRIHNLDRTMFYRYGVYMLNLVRGDLGVSDTTGLSVWNTYLDRLPNTLLLSLGALVIGASISVPMGIRAAKRAGTLTDAMTTTGTLIGVSMPSFWLGLMLLFVFSYLVGWFPAGGNRHGIRSFVLPAVTSSMILMATSTRQTRSSMLEVLKSDFLRTARAKGVPEKMVIRKHALGNAWIPIVTTMGTSLSVSLAGSAVIESVFAWPGVGRMTVEAVFNRDVTTATGAVIMTSIIYVLLLLIVDLLYAFIDPRIKAQYINTAKKRKRALRSADGSAESSGVYAALKNAAETTAANEQAPVQSAQESAPLQTDIEPVTADDSPKRSEYVTRPHFSDFSAHESSDDDTDELVTKKYAKRNRFGEIFHNLRKNRGAVAGLIILGVLILIFIGSLFISFESVVAINARARFSPPSLEFPFGADNMGRNAFLRVIYGSRYSLAIGFGAASISAFFGILAGAIAGYFGKVTDDVIMRVSDTLAAIPGMLLGMVIVTSLGQNLVNLIVAVGVSSIPVFVRITRAAVLTVKNHEFIEAARAIGLPTFRIIFTQIVPNGLAPIIITYTMSLGMAIMVSSSLSFLGFGVPPPHPEWGMLISGGRDFIRQAPWLTMFPGLFIMFTVLAFNLLGDGLRDALDPKLKKR